MYAVGVMLYEMLTGQMPFATDDGGYWGLVMQITTRDPDPPASIEPGISPALDAIVLRAMSKDPATRPNALELARALRDTVATDER